MVGNVWCMNLNVCCGSVLLLNVSMCNVGGMLLCVVMVVNLCRYVGGNVVMLIVLCIISVCVLIGVNGCGGVMMMLVLIVSGVS